MPYSAEFLAKVQTALAPRMSVEARPLFGGAGLLSEGLLFGMVVGSKLYLRAGPSSLAKFREAGAEPFAVGDQPGLALFETPEEVVGDAERLGDWAAEALAEARRAVQ
ncbi:MAG: TfoX/Sxy family protein [Fimbriimonadales bacterium]|nr:TfoX/Sxy family protein [Fimbriimonadales bacterium]